LGRSEAPSARTLRFRLNIAVLHERTYIDMQFEWDLGKAASNLRKHDIRFADAVTVFGDELALTVEDRHSAEERYVTIGMDAFGRVLVVVYTWRGDETIRLISARKATRTERLAYDRSVS